jgi:transcriptional regulator
MYTPKRFSENDPKRLDAFIRDNAFGILITGADGRPEASHIPFLLDSERRLLLGHFAAANPQAQRLATACEVLVVFQGPHGYISPSWYETDDVPTWNYTAVHVYGRPEIIRNDDKLRGIVDSLTAKYESQFDQPWQPVYRDKLLRAIMGFCIHITEVQGKFKLSQNRSAKDRANVIRELKKTGRESDAALAQLMDSS